MVFQNPTIIYTHPVLPFDFVVAYKIRQHQIPDALNQHVFNIWWHKYVLELVTTIEYILTGSQNSRSSTWLGSVVSEFNDI